MNLRPATASDQDAIIALIDSIYREYDDAIHLVDADRDLLDIPGNYGDGGFMALERDSEIVGTVALGSGRTTAEPAVLKRMYLSPTLRGSGWGPRLLDWACNEAARRGHPAIELWTDTRFERAHTFYANQGFQKTGDIRSMNDGLKPYDEYLYNKAL